MMKLQPVAAAALLAACLGGPGSACAAPEPSLAYTIQPRDNLITLGRQLLVTPGSWREVARFNRVRDQDLIVAGRTLQLPLRLLRSTEMPVSIVSVEGDVRVGNTPARAGTLVAKGQTLTTAGASSAILRLGDGSRVKVAPATEVSLGEHRRFELKAGTAMSPGTEASAEGIFASTMRLVRGSVETLATKVLRAKPLEVQTPTAVIGVRGTDYRVHYEADATNPTRTEVLEGRVRADASPDGAIGAEVPAGFGAALQVAKPPALAKLLPAPDLSGLPQRFERPVVRLALPPEPLALRLQVAADPSFDRLVRDDRLQAGEEPRIVGLEDGRWYLRLRRIDAAGIEGYDASREFVLKARPEPPATTQPQARQKLPVGNVPVGWTENLEAARYALEISRDVGFADVVQRVDALVGAQAQLTITEPGRYYWRMASLRADGDRGPWGDPRQFELRPLPESPKGGVSADGKTLEISWGGRSEDRQQVELARDQAFTDIVGRAELADTRWTPATPPGGTYYFRYRSVEPDGFTTPWSETLLLHVPRDWSFLMLAVPLLFAL